MAEFPLTVSVVGAIIAPIAAAIGALVALLTNCRIEIERVETPPAPEMPEPVQTEPEYLRRSIRPDLVREAEAFVYPRLRPSLAR